MKYEDFLLFRSIKGLLLTCLLISSSACTPVELVWVVDASGTITEEDHERSKKFISTIQTKIGMKDNGNKAAAVTYGKDAYYQIKCSDYDNVYDFKSYVAKMKRYPKERTNTRDGLEKGQELLTSHGCGENEKAQKIIVLLTDGLANAGKGGEKGLIEAAKHIQDKGIKILVVAIGKFSDHQLKKMVDEKYIHKTKLVGDDKFASLNNEDFVHQIKEAICGSVKPTKGKYFLLFLILNSRSVIGHSNHQNSTSTINNNTLL